MHIGEYMSAVAHIAGSLKMALASSDNEMWALTNKRQTPKQRCLLSRSLGIDLAWDDPSRLPAGAQRLPSRQPPDRDMPIYAEH